MKKKMSLVFIEFTKKHGSLAFFITLFIIIMLLFSCLNPDKEKEINDQLHEIECLKHDIIRLLEVEKVAEVELEVCRDQKIKAFIEDNETDIKYLKEEFIKLNKNKYEIRKKIETKRSIIQAEIVKLGLVYKLYINSE